VFVMVLYLPSSKSDQWELAFRAGLLVARAASGTVMPGSKQAECFVG